MKLLVVGAGNMAEALFLPLEGELRNWDISFYTPSSKRAESLAKKLKQNFLTIKDDWEYEFDGIFLAHKPQNLDSVQALLHEKLKTPPKFIVSILAGVSVEKIKEKLYDTPIFRMMPNTPCFVGRGIITYFCEENFNLQIKKSFENLFSKNSKLVYFSNEKNFDQATPVLGSGPGVVFELCLTFQKELESLGLSSELSKNLINELFIGSCTLSESTDESFGELRDKVTSKGGITERIIEILKESEVDTILKNSFEAGRERGKNL